jgi:membrane protein involved in colicin uptake
MADETKPNPEKTSDGDGKNTAGGGEGAATQTAKTEEAKTLTQEEVNKLIAKTKREAEEKHKRESEEAKRKQDEEEAKKKGEFETLAKTYEGERDAAKAERDEYKSKYEKLAESVRASAKAEIDALPEHIRTLAPSSDDLDLLLEWLPKAKQAVGKQSPPPPGNQINPKPVASGSGKEEADARKGQARIYQSL